MCCLTRASQGGRPWESAVPPHHLPASGLPQSQGTLDAHSLFFFFSFSHLLFLKWGFPGGLDHKESACSAEDLGLIPGSGRSPGEGNGNPLQYYTFSLEHWVKFSGPGQGGILSGPDQVLVIHYSTAAVPLKITVTSSDLSLISFDLRLIYSPWNTSFTGFLGYLTLHILPLPPWLFFLHLSSCPWSSLHLFALFGVWGQAQRCPFLFSTYTHFCSCVDLTQCHGFFESQNSRCMYPRQLCCVSWVHLIDIQVHVSKMELPVFPSKFASLSAFPPKLT